jgi:hypothetical protein
MQAIAEAALLPPIKSLDPRDFWGDIFRRHLNNVHGGTPWAVYGR